jgi:hypothetical protein
LRCGKTEEVLNQVLGEGAERTKEVLGDKRSVPFLILSPNLNA